MLRVKKAQGLIEDSIIMAVALAAAGIMLEYSRRAAKSNLSKIEAMVTAEPLELSDGGGGGGGGNMEKPVFSSKMANASVSL
jgi:hypothetical protein